MIRLIVFIFLLAVQSAFAETNSPEVKALYQDLKLEGKLDERIFARAMAGYNQINKKKEILVIVDFNKSSKKERFFVIDVANRKVLYQTLVAHGKNSGEEYATQFSNEHGSLKSSLGFYLTGESITSPKHGYAMILNGLELGVNDNARKRQVIVHGADYVSAEHVRKHGRLGRSWGCLALSRDLTPKIIDVIKGGAVVYVAADNKDYEKKTRY